MRGNDTARLDRAWRLALAQRRTAEYDAALEDRAYDTRDFMDAFPEYFDVDLAWRFIDQDRTFRV